MASRRRWCRCAGTARRRPSSWPARDAACFRAHGDEVTRLVFAEPVGVRHDERRGRPIAARRCRWRSPSRRARSGDRRRRGRAPAVAVPAWIMPRTTSPLRFSAARSTGGGAPSSRPQMSRRNIDWPSQPVVSPTMRMASPSRLKASVADLVKSSSNPTPPIDGVGRIARPLVSL